MFKKLLKLFVLSLLFCFTLSCTFVVKNTGEISFNLPKSSSLYSSKDMTRSRNTNLQYNVSIKPTKSNIRHYEFDAVLDEGGVVLYDIPVGKYCITISTEDNLYTYKGFQNFEIYGGSRTSIEINLSATLKPKPTPDPKPEPEQKPEVEEKSTITLKSNIAINDGAKFTLNVKLGDSSLQEYPKSDITLPYEITNLDNGIYSIEVIGKGSKNNYKATKNITITKAIKENLELQMEVTPIVGSISGNITGINKGDSVNENISLEVIAQSKDNQIKGVISQNLSSYSFAELPVGIYTISITGGNNQIYYSGIKENVEIKEGVNNKLDITLESNKLLGNIIGNVQLPSDTTNLTLKATAYSVTKNLIEVKSASVNSDGSFRITSVPEGKYIVKIEGRNNTTIFNGETKTLVTVQKNNDTTLTENIGLNETLITGSVSGKINGNVQQVLLTVKASINGKDVKSVEVLPDGSYKITDLPLGTYTLTVSGDNDRVYYSGSGEATIIEGENTLDLTVKEDVYLASIKGKVELPINKTDLTLTAVAEDTSTSTKNEVVVDNSTGIFTFDNIPVSTYKISVSGTSTEGNYVGSYTDVITLKKNQICDISSTTIRLTETLNKGSLILNPNITINDDAVFTIDLRKGNSQTSVPGYPIKNQKLPYTISNLDSGNYKVSVTGKGKVNNYKTDNIWQNITINPGFKESASLTLTANKIVGSLSGKLTGENIIKNISLNAVATSQNNEQIEGTISLVDKTYSFTSLPIGCYTISISGGNNDIHYSGILENVIIEEGKNTVQDINITSDNNLGNIAGTVTIPTNINGTGLTLTAYAYNTVTKVGAVNSAKVDLTNGNFEIFALPEGMYTVKVEGKTNTATYTGEHTTPEIKVVRTQKTNIETPITLKETLNKGTAKLVSGSSILDNANFTIDIRTNGLSLAGYPKENQKLPFALTDFEPGNYQVSIIGKGSENNYVSLPEWIDVVINPNDNKEQTVNLTKTPIVGSINGNFTGAKIQSGVTLKVIAKGNNITKEGTVLNNSSYEIKDLPIGEYSLIVSGSNDKVFYTGELINVKVNEGVNPKKDINIKENSQFGSITGNVTLPANKEGISLTAKALSSSSNLQMGDIVEVNTVTGNFTITNLPEGTYKVVIEGKNNTHRLSGEYNSSIKVLKNQTSSINGNILLIETLITGAISGKITGNVQQGVTLTVTATANGAEVKSVKVAADKSYKLTDLPVGTYTLTVSGESENVFYTGELTGVKVNEGDTPNQNIAVIENSQFGSISGKVNLPTSKEGLTLNVKAIDATSSKAVGNPVSVSIKDGSFTIKNLPKGTYKLTFEGSSNKATYSGKYDTSITVERNQESKLSNAISLTENLKNGSITLNSSISITDNAKFTIDIKKGTESSSLQGYPKSNQDLPYTLTDVEPGDYKVSITGTGSLNTYATKNTWQTVTVQPGVTDGSVKITIVATTIPGQDIPTSLYISSSGNDSTGDGKTANTAFATVSKAISLISDSTKEYTLNIIAPHESPIIDNVKINKAMNIKFVGDITGADINGTLSILNEQAQVSMENILFTSSDINGTVINTGILKLGKDSFIENNSTGNIAIALKDTGVLHYNGSSMFGDNNLLVIDNVNSNPYLMINVTNSDLLLPVMKIANIDNYLNSPLIKVGDGIDINTIIPNITLENKEYELTATGYLHKKEIVTPTITPDPSKGIFVVNALEGNDQSNLDGSNPFKTIYKAIQTVGATMNTLYIIGDVTETKPISRQSNNIVMKAPDNSTATINVNMSNTWFTIGMGVQVEMYGINIVQNSIENGQFTIKTDDRASLKLDEKSSITIKDTSKSKICVQIATNAVFTIASPKVIPSTNNIKVLAGGKINVLPGFNDIEGSIEINRENVGGEEGKQIITYNDSVSSSTDLANATKKFSILNNKYIIDENGKCQSPNGGGGSGENTAITDLWDATGLQNKIANGGTFGLAAANFTFDKTIEITKDVTFVVASDVTLKRSNMTAPIFNVAENAILTIKRKPGSAKGSVTFDGSADQSSQSFIVSSGKINLENCTLQNNKDTALLLNGAAVATLVDTIVTGNKAVNNGGGISLNPDKKGNMPELYLKGNTLISKNSVLTNKYGGGVYVNSGWVALEGNAKIASDNSADNTRGKALYFQSVTGGTQLNGKKPTNNIYDTEVNASTK